MAVELAHDCPAERGQANVSRLLAAIPDEVGGVPSELDDPDAHVTKQVGQ